MGLVRNLGLSMFTVREKTSILILVLDSLSSRGGFLGISGKEGWKCD